MRRDVVYREDMGTGAVLVVIGLIFSVLSLLVEAPSTSPRLKAGGGAFLAVGVILIAVGVLVGHTQFDTGGR